MANIIYSKDLLEKGGGVYKLYSASDVDIFYIGSTVNFYGRYKNHKHKLKEGKHTKKMQKYFDLCDLDELVMEVIDVDNDMISREQYWINKLKPTLNTDSWASNRLGDNTITMYNSKGEKERLFKSVLEATLTLKVGSGVINRHIQNGSKTPTNGKYFLKGSENPEKILTDTRRHKNQISVSIEVIDTGVLFEFESFRTAAESKLVSRDTLFKNKKKGALVFLHKNKYKIKLIE
jgi:group I intron endonuclease